MKHYPLPSINTKTETVILADGAFPFHPTPLTILRHCTRIICCDGAANQLLKLSSRLPDAIVGDCDSLSEESKIRFASIIHQINEQETNDLTKAVQYALNNGFDDMVILGATGKREDHAIGNVGLLAEYLNYDKLNVQLVTDYGVFTAVNESSRFESFSRQQVSIFSIDHQPITSQGLRYPIEKRIFSNWWQGTLNESESDAFTLETKGRIIVFRAF